MSFDEQQECFRKSPIRDKGDLLIRSHDPMKLTRGLSQEELYLVTKEMDLEEKSEIIRYATLPQIRFLSDMSCWQKDRFDSKGMLGWMETLILAGDEQVMHWFRGMDYESVVAGLKGMIQVLKPEWEYAADEMLGDQPYFTLDQMYYILVSEENYMVARRAIEILFERDRTRYTTLLEGILGEVDDLIEEEAFRNREMRLSDRGFPDFESANRIYRRIDREEFEKTPKKDFKEGALFQEQKPDYLMIWSSNHLFLDRALLLLADDDKEILERIEEELVWLSNKVIASEGIDFSSEERVKHGIRRARQFVSIALELVAKNNLNEAVQCLKQRWLETLFRMTSTALLDMREQALKIVRNQWQGDQDAFFTALHPVYESILRAVMLKVPEFYDPSVTDHPMHFRDFSTLNEVNRSHAAVGQVAAVNEWLSQTYQLDIFDTYQKLKDFCPEKHLFVMLATAFARDVLKSKSAKLKPLNTKALKEFKDKAFEQKQGRYFVRQEMKETFLNAHFEEDRRKQILPLWALVFEGLESALEDAADEGIEFRLIDVLWIASTV
ncbi:MAG: hypothetical protein H6757_01875 [Candidatus Omnitrophica bacterium]|nr:hypothetical protein [Candidatus Omnitrophota bacterium]